MLVGHSWGGAVALQYAVHATPAARACVLVDGGFSEMSRRMTWQEAKVRLRPPNTDMPAEQFRARIRERLGDRWSSAWEEAILGNCWIDDAGISRRNLAIENHMRILWHLYNHRPSELFPSLRCPTLLVPAIPPEGSGDPARAEALRAFVTEAERNPLVRTHWMLDTVHDVPLHRPRELATLIAGLAAQ
jgi:pimeloyl-ACP methyl ester carboxylesterase